MSKPDKTSLRGLIFIVKQLKNKCAPFYRPDPWIISEDYLSPANNSLSETVFALGNGYIGIRGSFEEGLTGPGFRSIEGIYLNGFYELVPIPHAETGYGYALNTQTMLNVTNSKIIELELEGERLNLTEGKILRFKRSIDMRKGFLLRELVWRSPQGREVEISIKRVVSFAHRHLMAFEYRVKALNFSGKVTVSSGLDGAVENHTHEEEDPRFSAGLGGLGLMVRSITAEEETAVMLQETRRSNLNLACAMDHHLRGDLPVIKEISQDDSSIAVNYYFDLNENDSIHLEKYVSYYTSLDYPVDDLPALAKKMADRGRTIGFQSLLDEQEGHLERLWEKAGAGIDGDIALDQGLRFNIFHLFQAAGCNGRNGIGAKGLTSEGYDGHYFWDTEIYMIPFYTAIMPEEARKLLEYRYSILDFARERARTLAHPRGALYPWRTIAGEEGSSYYPAGTAQYHINAAVAYAINKYIEMTGDYSLVLDFGAEIVLETARLWEDLGAYIPRKGNRFCYNEVTGPDEYTALVNNNFYTNLMAQWHLNYAYETACNLEENHPEVYRRLAEKIDLDQEELQAWKRAADNMFIPYDTSLQIHPQDDGFLDKEPWNFAGTTTERYPLLLNYHPLVIYRYQVCKQPDVILAHFLLNDHFSLDQKCRDYNYYEPITTHDSSLSPSIFGIMASELGFSKDAGYFFDVTARLDLDNCLKDTHFGLHMANMAGSWMSLVYGFAGMRTTGGRLIFSPYLPAGWDGYHFKIIFKGKRLGIEIKGSEAVYNLCEGDSIRFQHRDKEIILAGGEKVVLSLN